MTMPKIIASVIALVLAILLVPTAWVTTWIYVYEHWFAASRVKQSGISAYLNPDDVTNLWIYQGIGIDRSEQIRFDAALPQTRKFLKSMPCQRVEEHLRSELDLAVQERFWWTPPALEKPQLRLDCEDKNGYIDVSMEYLGNKNYRIWIKSYTI